MTKTIGIEVATKRLAAARKELEATWEAYRTAVDKQEVIRPTEDVWAAWRLADAKYLAAMVNFTFAQQEQRMRQRGK